jgi:chromosome segregation ATPase
MKPQQNFYSTNPTRWLPLPLPTAQTLRHGVMVVAVAVHVALFVSSFFSFSLPYVTGMAFVGTALLLGARAIWNRSNHSALKKTLSAFQNNNRKLAKTKKKLKGEVVQFSKENKNLKTEVQSLHQTKQELDTEVSRLSATTQTIKEQLAEENDKLNTSLVALDKTQERLNHSVTSLDTTSTTLCEGLEQEVRSFQKISLQIQELLTNNSLGEKLQALNLITRQLEALKIDYTETQTKYECENQHLSDLIGDIARLKQEHELLHNKYVETQKKLERNVQDLSSEVSRLQSTPTAFQD